ncbi:hypothetical protein BLNAU_13615 [Blattamonas nauphoetae]|uniref:Uncharacterized protein n=1 Tax=Blattamonas nauphoetae TaxID=2049346 RepID=A0ABQ9XG66_9EUKA|nr:hypothetical protein BLNAU_13615 [Blattamonas nauphoetae]
MHTSFVSVDNVVHPPRHEEGSRQAQTDRDRWRFEEGETDRLECNFSHRHCIRPVTLQQSFPSVCVLPPAHQNVSQHHQLSADVASPFTISNAGLGLDCQFVHVENTDDARFAV